MKYLAKAERFGSLYEELQAALPRGDTTARVRMVRTRPARSGDAATLGDTLGQEEATLVLLDPGELPRSWDAVSPCRPDRENGLSCSP